MEAYKVKQKVTDRTLTVELPEEFRGAEVEVVVLKDKTTSTSNSNWEEVRKFEGIARGATIEIDEEEWYKQ